MTLSRHEAYMRRRAARQGVGDDMAARDMREAVAGDEAAPLDDEGPLDTAPEALILAEPEPEPEPEPVRETEPVPAPALDPGLLIEAPPASLPATVASGRAVSDPQAAWAALREVTLERKHLVRNRLISATREDPAHVAFDVLRTKLLAALRKQGWHRVAITSATPDCGKSFVAANLAISLSRKPGLRTVLMDMDLRRPSLAKLFGVARPGPVAPLLLGETDAGAHLLRPAPNDLNIGQTLALCLNDRAESYAAELLQSPATGEALAAMQAWLAPDVVLYDMPPALYHDDVLAFRPHFDGVLIVVAGGMSTAQEVRDLRDRLGTDTPLLGVVMNRAEGEDITRYDY